MESCYTSVVRKIALTVLLLALAPYLFAARIMMSLIGPSTSTARVTLSAAGSGVRNCLTDLDVVSDAAYTLRILDGGTTVYALALAANGGIARNWGPDNPFCGTANTLMEITVSAGTFSVNYAGFTGQ